jgi:L-ascorbate metabolism protein UlaG (beta-lactamase superfamily)
MVGLKAWRRRAGMGVAALLFASLPLFARAAAPDCPAPAPPPSDTVRVRFMGVSTLLVEDGQTQILLDGFFSRPNPFAVKFGRIQPSPERIRKGLCRGGVGRPVAVLAAHAHYDHAMDAAEIVAERGGRLVGSESVVNIGRGRRLDEAALVAFEGRQAFQIGCFRVTAIPALHASPDRWEGEITQPLTPPVPTAAYRNGGASAFIFERGGLRILVHPSAGSLPGLYAGEKVDIAFLGVGGLGVKDGEVTRALWKEAVARTGARHVYPIHWDNFTRGLGRRMVAAPWPFDNIARTRKRLLALASASEPPVQITLPKAFEAFQFRTPSPDGACGPDAAGSFVRLK